MNARAKESENRGPNQNLAGEGALFRSPRQAALPAPQRSNSQHKELHDPAFGKLDSRPDDGNKPKGFIGNLQMDYEKGTQVEKTRFGRNRNKTTWKFLLPDKTRHVVVLMHNQYMQGGKSKRVLTIDGVEQYNYKSDQKTFSCSIGSTKLKLEIKATLSNSYTYHLTINGESFEKLRKEFYVKKSGAMSGAMRSSTT